jgi:hypothetical protein
VVSLNTRTPYSIAVAKGTVFVGTYEWIVSYTPDLERIGEWKAPYPTGLSMIVSDGPDVFVAVLSDSVSLAKLENGAPTLLGPGAESPVLEPGGDRGQHHDALGLLGHADREHAEGRCRAIRALPGQHAEPRAAPDRRRRNRLRVGKRATRLLSALVRVARAARREKRLSHSLDSITA